MAVLGETIYHQFFRPYENPLDAVVQV